HLIQEAGCYALRVRHIRELAFSGEGVGIEPVEQFRPEASNHLHLWQMRMGVDEARHHKMWPVIYQMNVVACLASDVAIVPDRLYDAIVDQQRAVSLIPVAGSIVRSRRFSQEG